jgi:NifU-like protein involved in Fe-S cluster formation
VDALTDGCATTIASGSTITEPAKGRAVVKALSLAVVTRYRMHPGKRTVRRPERE